MDTIDIKERGLKCIAIGVSAGGMEVLKKILKELPKHFPIPIVIVQHLHPNQGEFYIKFFDELCKIKVKEAKIGEKLEPEHIYFAPPNYHLLLDENERFLYSVDQKVNFSRPSVDVFFDCVAEIFDEKLLGIILTGANNDGALGMKLIHDLGGITVAQNPESAEVYTMPLAAIEATKIDLVLHAEEIIDLLKEIA
jgi:two-component system chemotaxis response regulator CheB